MEPRPTPSDALSRFAALLADNASLSPADLPMVDELLAAYPYFTLPAAMMLKSDGLSNVDRERLNAAVALNAPDADTLMKLIDPDGSRWADFYPEGEPVETPDTDTAIDTFLDTYGDIDPHEKQLLERLIFNPVPDYSQVLAAEEAESPEQPAAPLTEQDALLDAFLAKQDIPAPQPAPVQRPARPGAAKADADSPLSESLAKIYIKQGRYDKAYEIIYQLSLNFPKKSIYFADQLRFLKKAMLIAEANKKKQSRK